MKIFPEFFLGGFPPKILCSPTSAYERMRDKYDDDVLIFGYSEMDKLDFYSSALIVDGDSHYSTRKTEPWGKEEKKVYKPSPKIPKVFSTSIGNLLVLLCNDAFEVKFGQVAYSKQLWQKDKIDLIVVLSHWQNGIDEFLVKRGILRLSKGTECNKWILCDTFNGYRDSGNINFKYSFL